MPQSRRTRLRNRKSTRSVRDFLFMVKHFRQRVNIVAEGDSWFDFPRKLIIVGKPANLMDHIQRWTYRRANLLRLESTGDEATAILSTGQRHRLAKLLHDCASRPSLRPIDVLLFSAGGNDVVGEWDLPRFLKPYKPGYTAEDCIRKVRLDNKVKQVELAYIELIDLCRDYSPDTVVVTHTYDRIYPSDTGFKLAGIGIASSWVKPYLDEKGIPAALQRPVAAILLGSLQQMLLRLASRPAMQGRLVVVDTMGTLTSKAAWLNEIHPTSKGFERLAKKLYASVRQVAPSLPPASS